METTVLLRSKYEQKETISVLSEIFEKQLSFTQARLSAFINECKYFEKKYKINTDQFICKFESGELGDEQHWFDWYASFKGKAVWEKKYNILKDISWKQ